MKVGVGVSLLLIAWATAARAEDDTHARFRATMNSVFGEQAWRVTGGYRTQARENELRRQGALTVRPGAISRHSTGRPDAPGAYDLVVHGLSPFQAAERLRRAGAPFRTIFPEGAHGSQGAHLHIDPYPRGADGKEIGPPPILWKVANPTPAQQAIIALHGRAQADDGPAQLELGRIYAEGKTAPRNLVEAYVWTALAATNDAADAQVRLQAQQNLGDITAAMSPDDLASARRFLPDPSEGGEARARAYGPIIAKPSAPQGVRIAQGTLSAAVVASGSSGQR
jgi:hypothetical protein